MQHGEGASVEQSSFEKIGQKHLNSTAAYHGALLPITEEVSKPAQSRIRQLQLQVIHTDDTHIRQDVNIPIVQTQAKTE